MENITPQAQYDLLDVVKISGFIDRRKGLGRPTKREGRELARFAEEVNDGWDFDDSDFNADSRYDFDFDEEDFN